MSGGHALWHTALHQNRRSTAISKTSGKYQLKRGTAFPPWLSLDH
jgi:hypothetical protein